MAFEDFQIEIEKDKEIQDTIVYGRILPSHITHQDRILIAKLIKKAYKEGFLNGMEIIK